MKDAFKVIKEIVTDFAHGNDKDCSFNFNAVGNTHGGETYYLQLLVDRKVLFHEAHGISRFEVLRSIRSQSTEQVRDILARRMLFNLISSGITHSIDITRQIKKYGELDTEH